MKSDHMVLYDISRSGDRGPEERFMRFIVDRYEGVR